MYIFVNGSALKKETDIYAHTHAQTHTHTVSRTLSKTGLSRATLVRVINTFSIDALTERVRKRLALQMTVSGGSEENPAGV